MKNIYNRHSIADEVYFTSITDKKFKINSIAVNFVTEMSHSAAENAVLTRILTKCCEKYNTMAKLNRRLSELYSAGLNWSVSVHEDYQLCTVYATMLDNRFALDGENIMRETAGILVDCIFSPNLEDGRFPEQDIAIEKQNQTDDNDSEINDKTRYAYMKGLEEAFRGEPAALRWGGTNEEVGRITGDDLMKAYRRMISETRAEIICTGESDFKGIEEIFADAFAKAGRSAKPLTESNVSPLKPEASRITETLDIEQSKLVMMFKTPLRKPYDLLVTEHLYGGTESSKLFMNVREKMSLCYYCLSGLQYGKGLVSVNCGVAPENLAKAESECLNQLGMIAAGDFTDEEVENVKLYIINSYRASNDTVSGISGKCLGAILCPDADVDVEEKIRKVRAVTREDIIEAAGSFKLDTVFILRPEETEDAE